MKAGLARNAGVALVLMKAGVLPAVLFFGAIAPVDAAARNLSAGEKLYKRACRVCHGPTPMGVARYAGLAGRDGAYLAERLERYRAGERIGPDSPLMWPVAAKLSNEDIANLTLYISTLSSE